MNKYYCPYCNPKYQFPKQTISGKWVCGLCGEDLVKKSFIKINQIIAIIAALSFILPLIYSLFFIIKDQLNTPSNNFQAKNYLIQKIENQSNGLNKETI